MGIFGENFPYTNFHNLNMDWIIKIAKDFLDQYTHIQELIEEGKTDIQELTTSGLTQLQEKAEYLEGLLQDWYDTHSADIADQLADALEDITEALETAITQITSAKNTAVSNFQTEASAIGQEVIASIPEDYTLLYSLLTQIKTVYLINEFDPESATMGGYCNASGAISSNVKFCYYKIPVQQNDIIYFRNFDYETFGQTFACIFNSSDEFLYRLTYPHADGYVEITPATASYILVNCTIEKLFNFMVFKNYNYTGSAYVPHSGISFDNNQFNVAYGQTVNTTADMKPKDILLHSGFIDNAYVNSDGDIITTSASAPNYRIYTIPVTEGEVLILDGKYDAGIQVPMIATFDSTSSFIKKYLYQPTDRARTHSNETFIVPEGVAYVYFTIQKVYADYYHCYKSYNKNTLRDRTWTIIGDSISSSKGHAHQLYSDLISVETGIKINTLASAGMGYKNGADPFYSQALRVTNSCDILTIMGSINDSPYTLGTKDDTGTDTLGGCINQTIINALDTCPTAHIGLITPTPTSTNMPYDDNCFLAKLSDLIIQISKKRGIPVLDLFHCSNLRPNIPAFRVICFTDDAGGQEDTTHPNTEGHKMFCNRIREFIQSL